MTADPHRIAKLGKLLDAQRNLLAQLQQIQAELDAVMGGKASIGDRIKAFEAHWRALWDARYKHDYVFTWSADAPILKRLLSKFTDDDLHRRASAYMSENEQFYVAARHPFRLFASKINCFVPVNGANYHPKPTDCQHEPACATSAEHTKRMVGEMRLDGWQ